MQEGAKRHAYVDEGQSDCLLQSCEVPVVFYDGEKHAKSYDLGSLADHKADKGEDELVLPFPVANFLIENIL